MNDISELKTRLLNDLETFAEYNKQAPEFAIARELIAARVRAGLTQDDIAERMNTTQSTIARLESGRSMPSLRTFFRYAKATDSCAVIRLDAAD